MPELPEVETTKTSLKPLIHQTASHLELYQPKLRWPVPKNIKSLQNHRFSQVDRRAKYLILDFYSDKPDQTKKLIMHLGMSGSLQQHPIGTPKRKHDHLIFTFESTQLHYHDPRRFGAIVWYDEFAQKLFDHLGVEPLSDDFNAEYLWQKIHLKPPKKAVTKAIKSFIMDQAIVVGVGNIYATESLFLSQIHPAQPACQVHFEQLQILVKHIKTILQKAIIQGGSSLKDFITGEGKTGYFQQTLLAYGRQNQACIRCQTPLQSQKINGRASVFCPKCQAY